MASNLYRVRRCRDKMWYVQQKRAPGLAGGIWKRIGTACLSERGANLLLSVINGKAV